jgi:predicted acyl esterase
MGFTQWALLMDPPPELTAAAIAVAPHDFSRLMYFGGAFAVKDVSGGPTWWPTRNSSGSFAPCCAM